MIERNMFAELKSPLPHSQEYISQPSMHITQIGLEYPTHLQKNQLRVSSNEDLVVAQQFASERLMGATLPRWQPLPNAYDTKE